MFRSCRPIIFTLYSPIFLLLTYIWLVPESVRWLLSKGRIDEAKEILRKVAKTNGKEISENSLDKLSMMAQEESQRVEHPFKEALKSTPLMLRLINCCFCWITCTFLFYGLTLNSVALAGNSYLDFILTSLVEIPAYVSCNFMVDKWGRRKTLCWSYILTGAGCAAFIFIPEGERHFYFRTQFDYKLKVLSFLVSIVKIVFVPINNINVIFKEKLHSVDYNYTKSNYRFGMGKFSSIFARKIRCHCRLHHSLCTY